MTRAELLELLGVAGHSIRWVKAHAPNVFARLQGLVLQDVDARLQAAFADAPEELRNLVSTAIRNRVPAAKVAQHLREAWAKLGRKLIKDGEERLSTLEGAGAFDSPLDDEDTLVDDLELFQDELALARVYRVCELAQVPSQALDEIVKAADTVAAVDDDLLDELVPKTLNQAQASALGLCASLFLLFDEDAALTKAVLGANVGRGADGKLRSARELAELTSRGWAALLTRAKVDPPSGTTAEAYALALARRFATLYPSEAFVRRLPSADPAVVAENIRAVTPLFSSLTDPHDPVLEQAFDELTLPALDATALAALETAFRKLARLCHAYPGLELAALLEDTNQSAEERARVVSERVAWVHQVLERHPDKELLFLDYAPDDEEPAGLELERLGLSAADQARVLATLKAYQRAHALSDDVDEAHAHLLGGVSGASHAGTMSLERYQAVTGLDEATAKRHHQKARATLGATTRMAVASFDVMQGGFDRLRVANVGPDAKDMLRRFQGFSALFGNQGYCRCDECRSIVGPAAYFVDLMEFVDEHIRQKFFRKKGSHPLNLKTRRPDLWELPLSCENTSTLVASLDIANEVLENYIGRSVAAAGRDLPLHPRHEVESVVYEQTLARSARSFGQPFVLPLARLNGYLAHFKRDRGDVARALGATGGQLTRAELDLPVYEYHAITHADLRPAYLNGLYDHVFEVRGADAKPDEGADDGDKLVRVDVVEFLRATGLSRDEFGAIVESHFVGLGSGSPRIVSAKSSAASVQADTERVKGLSYNALDRIHRFTRLWRHFDWLPGELDVVLRTLKATELNAETLQQVADVRRAKQRLHISVEETCALFGQIPGVPVQADGSSLFDRLFNTDPPHASGRSLPDPQHPFLHPALRLEGSHDKADPSLPRLLAGLRISDDELLLLLTVYLSGALGIDPDNADEDKRRFALNSAHISLLYRHARLAERLRLSIPELFRLLSCVPRPAGQTRAVNNLEELTALLDFHAWWKNSGFSLDDLAVITGKEPSDPSAYPAVSNVVLETLRADSASPLSFAETVFAVALGVTEDTSRAITLALGSRIQLVTEGADGSGGVYRLASDFDPNAPLTLPDDLGVAEADVRGALAGFHASRVVPSRLSAVLQMKADKVAALIDMTGESLLTSALALALAASTAAEATDPPPEAQPLVELVSKLLPFTVLFKAASFDAEAVRFANASRSAFGLEKLPIVDMTAIRAVSVYARFAPQATNVAFEDDAVPPDPADLRKALANFQAASGFAPKVHDELARLLGTKRHALRSLMPHVSLSAPAALAFEQLATANKLAQHLGVGGAALAAAVAPLGNASDLAERATHEYDALERAADALLGAFRSRYDDDDERAKELEPHQNKLRDLKRDALTDYLLHTYHPAFKDLRAIYEYFLIDVELAGVARTSRVVSATNSVQLYVQRCLLGLEEDRRSANADDHVDVQLTKDVADEWHWRKAYRVWQAARKIFLYPENYLEPDLRDDKTPLFEELEATLLQKQIDQQSVLDAYTAYADAFEEVGNLTIAGACSEKDDDDDETLHLIGVTSSDPPVYYYRAIESPYSHKRKDRPVYHPWRKISVQIPVRKASPVVHRNRLLVFWLEVRTESRTHVADGGSTFTGYRHRLALKYTSLRLDGKWTPPQEIRLPKGLRHSDGMAGSVTDYFPEGAEVAIEEIDSPTDKVLEVFAPRLKLTHWTKNPIDDYSLSGPNWDTPYPESLPTGLVVVMRNFRLVLDVYLFSRTSRAASDVSKAHRIRRPKAGHVLLSTKQNDDKTSLYFGSPLNWYASKNAFANLVLEDERISRFDGEYGSANDAHVRKHLHPERNRIAELRSGTELLAVSGAIEHTLLQSSSDLVLIARQRKGKQRYRAHRLGTTLATNVARKVFNGGVSALLSLETQQGLREGRPGITPVKNLRDATNAGSLDFAGPYGVYYREIFFHIPFLIAHHLNSQGDFAAARKWYHHLFDPTADGQGNDRAWRYLEFRNQDWPTLRKILKDQTAIEAAQQDPFNPHAIARSRMSAYAKAVVMKYMDNLLDWGDRLFGEFTMESVNEATLLYTMVADLLGERPYQAADCGQAKEGLTFHQIHAALARGTPFLYELETHAAGKSERAKARRNAEPAKYAVDPQAIAEVRAAVPLVAPASDDDPNPSNDPADSDSNDATAGAARGGPAWKNTAQAGRSANKQAAGRGPGQAATVRDWPAPETVSPASFGWSVVRQMGPVFCVPPNEDLLHYWNRVDDRLYKIHHSLDIHGKRRDLALFAPELDPHLLSKMKAAGLSLDDLTNATSGDLPPYRFLYLIEKAKSFASTLQSFGSALLSALEKKDAEELARLRLVHEQNILKMTTQLKQAEIDAAEETIQATTKQVEAAEFRREHYRGLLDGDLSGWETTEEAARHAASTIRGNESALWLGFAIAGQVPDLGSPFAMKYGGTQLSKAFAGFAGVTEVAAMIADNIAGSAALEASFGRRREEWQLQHDLADRDAQQLNHQLLAAQFRKQLAQKSLQVPHKSIEQAEELHALYADKFTNFGLFTWLAGNLQRTYRHAYANALSLARLCQSAFEYERDAEPRLPIGATCWDGAHAGLLAGEKLLLELQNLERRFIETNYRTLEVEQSLPLGQIDPTALLRLRETGECEFELPEVFFDIAYPGHYRRRIKAARLTIPCVTGPYTNVGATLTLTGSSIRSKPDAKAPPTPVPLKRTVSIATSRAQNDAGVFELSFHDERYMPFEGAGAISKWKLELPKTFRSFDYDTISDVVLTLNYTALSDDKLRRQVEGQKAQLESQVAAYLRDKGLTRVLSMRQEFPVAFRELLSSPPQTPVSFEIKDWHFPAFVAAAGMKLQAKTAMLAVRTAGEVTGALRLAVDGSAVEGFVRDERLGGLLAANIAGPLLGAPRGEHTVALINTAGSTPPSVDDVLIVVQYRVVSA